MWRKLWKLLRTPLGELLRRKATEAIERKLDEMLAPAVTTNTVARHVPKPGTAIVELLREDGSLLALDTVPAAPSLPGEGIQYTNVVVPNGPKEYRHIEFTVASSQPMPFPLPDHLKRADVASVKVWWSQESA